MSPENLSVLAKIINAVETGGQVYGKARYNDYTPPYTNSKKEHTITLGCLQAYGHQAKDLIQMIYLADPDAFRKIDTAGIYNMLAKDWEAIRWNPSQKQKEVLIKLIDSPVGHKCQDELLAERCKSMVAECKKLYPSADEKAQMMFAEIRHLGGLKPTKRIFDRCKDYSLDSIMASLVKDQNDTSSNNQVGDKKYWSRHVKCREFIDRYYISEDSKGGETVGYDYKKVLEIAEAEVGYHEKKTGDLKYLYDKTANSGSNNYTKYNYEMHQILPSVMDYPAAWCDCFNDWCFYKAYGLDGAKKLLCGNFDDYTPNSAQKYKDKGRWGTEAKVAAQIFFKNSQRICHTGIVYKVTDKYVYTIEGNKNNEVRKKSYLKTNSTIAGYGYPLYDSEPTPTPTPTKDLVKKGQKQLNNYLADYIKADKFDALIVDGDFGRKTMKNFIRAYQHAMNQSYGLHLEVDGIYGRHSKAAGRNYPTRRGQRSYVVSVLEIGMLLNNIDPNGVEYPGIYASGLASATTKCLGTTEIKEAEWTRLFTL